MSKLKTHRGTAKRFKLTASGAVKRKQSHRRHILTKKSSKRKRHLRSSAYLAPCDAPLVIRLLVGC